MASWGLRVGKTSVTAKCEVQGPRRKEQEAERYGLRKRPTNSEKKVQRQRKDGHEDIGYKNPERLKIMRK
jgi:hypothetical protein